MVSMPAVWQRFPTIVRALISGVAVTLGGLQPWAGFSLLNQKYGVAVPWAVVPTASRRSRHSPFC